jgi:hypothetical protein
MRTPGQLAEWRITCLLAQLPKLCREFLGDAARRIDRPHWPAHPRLPRF